MMHLSHNGTCDSQFRWCNCCCRQWRIQDLGAARLSHLLVCQATMLLMAQQVIHWKKNHIPKPGEACPTGSPLIHIHTHRHAHTRTDTHTRARAARTYAHARMHAHLWCQPSLTMHVEDTPSSPSEWVISMRHLATTWTVSKYPVNRVWQKLLRDSRILPW